MIQNKHVINLQRSPYRGVITEVGLGVPVVNTLTRLHGCSKILLEGSTHYDRSAQPESSFRAVSQETAALLAENKAHQWNLRNSQDDSRIFSLAVTGVFKTPEERGETHAWVCLITSSKPVFMHFTVSEEACVLGRSHTIDLAGAISFYFAYAHMVRGGLAAFKANIDQYKSWIQVDVIDSPLFSLVEQLALVNKYNPMIFRDGKAIRAKDELRQVTRLYRGSFNPPTLAHNVIGGDALYEIALTNARKSRADLVNVAHRIRMLMALGKTVLITDGTPLFIDLDTQLRVWGVNMRNVTYVMGADTYYRVLEPDQYDKEETAAMMDFLADASIELTIDPEEFAQSGLGQHPWIGDKVVLSKICEHPDLKHRSSPVREGGLDHIHALPDVVQRYVEEHDPYDFAQKT